MLSRRGAVLAYSTKNIGDDMQSLAARRFFPEGARGLQREGLSGLCNYFGLHKLIMNGWFMRKPRQFPPAKTIDPLVISFHLSENDPRRTKVLLSGGNLE